jgi:predicted metalloendopeptidase
LFRFFYNFIDSNFAPIRTLSEVFTLSFLYVHQWLYNPYPFDGRRQIDRGTKKAYQRWETCLKDIQFSMRPAIELLYNRKYNDENVNKAVKDMTKKVIDLCVETITKNPQLPLGASIDVIAKLGTMKVIVGFTESIISFEKLDEYYSELNLNGSENYLDLWHNILRYQQKIRKEPNTSWRKKIDDFSKNSYMKYDVDENELCE